jgi:hypothetical protein
MRLVHRDIEASEIVHIGSPLPYPGQSYRPSQKSSRPLPHVEKVPSGVAEYLSVLNDAAFGAATPTEPKSISPTDPAARYTAAADTPAVYAYSDNYLVDLKNAVITRAASIAIATVTPSSV